MNQYTRERRRIQDAQTAFVLTHGAAAFWLWSRYWAWWERQLRGFEEIVGGDE